MIGRKSWTGYGTVSFITIEAIDVEPQSQPWLELTIFAFLTMTDDHFLVLKSRSSPDLWWLQPAIPILVANIPTNHNGDRANGTSSVPILATLQEKSSLL